MPTTDAFSNFAITTVSGAPSPATSGTSITLTSATNFPDPASVGQYNVIIYPTAAQPLSSNAEIVRVTAKAGSVLTIIRTQESTSARTVIVGDNIAMAPTAAALNSIGTWTTWTPTVTQSGAVTVTVSSARYSQIGKTVFFELALAVTGTGSAANEIVIAGWPGTFQTDWSGIPQYIGQGALLDTSATLFYPFLSQIIAANDVRLRSTASGIGTASLGNNQFTAALAAGDSIRMSGNYEVA